MALVVKNLPANAGDLDAGFSPWGGNITWRRARQPILGFLPGESLGQRSLAGYSPWGHKELGMTKVTEHARMLMHMALFHSFLRQTGIPL